MRLVARVTLVTLAWVGVTFAGAGCFSPNLGDQPFKCGANGLCPPGYECVGDLCSNTGENPPDARACTGNATTCDGDTLMTCTGGTVVSTSCPAGCNAGASPPACFRLSPSNLTATACAQTASPLSISGTLKKDTDNCILGGGAVVTQSGGAPPLCVFTVGDLTVAPGATLSFGGARIPVLVALGTARIDGTISVAATGLTGGPGASVTDTASRGGSAGLNASAGGGGGGHLTDGARGGIAIDSTTSLTPGGHPAGVPSLSPVTPGGYGGTGGTPCATSCSDRTVGGGGGGAIEIVSCTAIVFGSSAIVNAGGGGGAGGMVGIGTTPIDGGGDGGGAGGGILVEAPTIDLPSGAILAANGGGGGGGAARVTTGVHAPGQPGADGPAAKDPAGGGEAGSSNGGKGGQGGTGDSGLPKDGGKGLGAGGGGGAAGRIRLNTRADHPPETDRATISPAATTGQIVVQ